MLDRQLRLEKVVASKHYRLAVETDEERRARLENDAIYVYKYCVDICTWLWGKKNFCSFFKIELVATEGWNKPSAINCTTHFIVRVTRCRVSVQSFLLTKSSKVD